MNILAKAQKLVYDKRHIDYGHPSHNWTRTARMWSAVLGIDVTPQQAILCMITMKVSRLCGKYKPDSLVDIAGYAQVYQMLKEELCGKQNE